MSNLIQGVITPAQVTIMDTAVQAIKGGLPVIPMASGKEIKAKQKLGNAGISYVTKSAAYGETYFSIMPKEYDLTEVKEDRNLYDALTSLEVKLGEVYNMVQVMRTMAGIDVMSHANSGYEALKIAAKSNASLKAVVDELGEFYKK